MAAEWYYAVKNQRHGPVTLEELQAKAVHQELKPTDLVWKPGFAAWTPAQKVPGIFLDKTMMGEVAAEAEPHSTSNLEKTEVSAPSPAPVARLPMEATQVEPARHTDDDKLFLTELPGASPVEGIDSLTGDALPPRTWHRPRSAPEPEPEAALGGFALRWNLREVAVSAPERSQFQASGVEEPRLQQYLAWRRSLLQLLIIPAALCVIFGLVAVAQQEGLTGLGRLVGFLQVVPLLALPVAILWATTVWWQWKYSRNILVVGWLFALAMPLLLGLTPPDWQLQPMPPGALAVWGLALFLPVLPALWTVLPGLLRAALRLKELMPEDAFTGGVAMAAALLHALVTAAFLLALNALVGNLFLVLAGLCFTLAPLAYLWKAPSLLQPLSTEEEKTAVALGQLLNLGLTAAGFVLLLIYVCVTEIAGRKLLGTTAETSWFRPWNGRLLLFPFELFTRSLLTTLVAADVLLLASVKFWRHVREQQGTPTAQAQEVFLGKVEREITR